MAAKKLITTATDQDIQNIDSIVDIDTLIVRLESRKEEIAAVLEDDALADIEELLSSKGLSKDILRKLIPASSGSNRKQRSDLGTKQVPYYRSIENQSLEAGKRGRKPAWLVAEIEQFGIEKCMISNQEE
jgi:hypothetical protein